MTEIQIHNLLHCILSPEIRTAVTKVINCQLNEVTERIKKTDFEDTFSMTKPERENIAIFETSCPHYEEQRIMREAGAVLIGTGAERDVYMFDGCVVKIPHDIGDRRANIVEDTIWDTAAPNVRQLLTPIIDADKRGLYVSMPYVSHPHSEYESIAMAEDMKQELRKNGYDCYDIHRENVGTLEGIPVILDYGLGFVSCQMKVLEHARIQGNWRANH